MRFRFLVLLMATLLVIVMPAAAQSSVLDDYSGLAQYYPQDTWLFAAITLDDTAIDQIDGIVAQVGEHLPPGILPPTFSIRSLFNLPIERGLSVRDVIPFGISERASIGIWGDANAMMESGADTPPLLIAFEITDADAAIAYATTLLTQGQAANADAVEQSTAGDFTLVSRQFAVDETVTFAINGDVMLLALNADDLPLDGLETPLSANASFISGMTLLPNDSYMLVMYSDTTAISRMSMGMSQPMMGFGGRINLDWVFELMDAALAAQGPGVMGLAIINDRTLVVDTVQLTGDTSALEAIGINMNYAMQPVDLGFAANIPADAPFVIQGTNLGPLMVQGYDNLVAVLRYVNENLETDRPLPDFEQTLRRMNLAFTRVTGVDMFEDVLPWMDGDFAMYVRVLPTDTAVGLTIDVAGVIEVGDSDAAVNLINQMDTFLSDFEFDYSRVDDTLVMPSIMRAMLPHNTPPSVMESSDIDFLVGTNGTVFAFGTRPGVEFSLQPGDSLADDATFIAAQSVFLPDAEMVMYLNLQPLFPIIEQSGSRPNIRQTLTMFNIIESASVTAYTTDEGQVARFALTISDEPLPASGDA